MSHAFTREPNGDNVPQYLPERPVSTHPNWVTPEGMRQIELRIQQLQQQREQAKTAQDSATLAPIERDLRYWLARRASAHVVEPNNADTRQIRFGIWVTLLTDEGVEQQFKLVGEDEADPAAGLISWTAPVAQALIGREVGEEVPWRGHNATIIHCSLEPRPRH